jgi:hypothetical protein
MMFRSMGMAQAIPYGDGPGAAAMMAGAQKMGERAAERMRDRFYKEEWKQVIETRIKPEQAKLKAAEATFKKFTTASSKEYSEIVTAAEMAKREERDETTTTSRAKSNQKNQQTAQEMGQQSNPGAEGPAQVGSQGKNASESEAGSTQDNTQTVSTNPAVNPGKLGAQEFRQEMMIPDPSNPERDILLNSAEGMAAYQSASFNFHSANAEIQQTIMTIASEYDSPYAQNFMKSLMKGAMGAANNATTGQSDPNAAQAAMDKHRKMGDDHAAAKQLQEQNEEAAARRSAADRSSGLAFDQKYDVPGGLYSDQFSGEGLTDIQKGADLAQHEKTQQDAITLAKAEGTVRLPEQLMQNPGQQMGRMAVEGNDAQYMAKVSRATSSYVAQETQQAMANPTAFMARYPELSDKTHPDYISNARVIALLDSNNGNDPLVDAFIQTQLRKTDMFKVASTTAYLERSREMARLDPRRNDRAAIRGASLIAKENPNNEDIQALAELDPHWLLASQNATNMFPMPDGSPRTPKRSEYNDKMKQWVADKKAGRVSRGRAQKPRLSTPNQTTGAAQHSAAPETVQSVAPTAQSTSSPLSTQEVAAATDVPAGPAKRSPLRRRRGEEKRDFKARVRQAEWAESGLGPKIGRGVKTAARAGMDAKLAVESALLEVGQGMGIAANEAVSGASRGLLAKIAERRGQTLAEFESEIKETTGSGTLASNKSGGTIGEN